MKKIVKSFLVLSLISSTINAGPLYPGCIVLCEAACVTASLIAGGTPAPLCFMLCPSGCVLSCFSRETQILVNEFGQVVSKDIEKVKTGDLVATKKEGEIFWTKVLRNQRSQGEFPFVEVTVKNLHDGALRQIRITPEHGLVHVGNEGQLTIDVAANVQVGDKMMGINGTSLSVVDVSNLLLPEKYTLETEDGTVLASELLMTTLCHEELSGGERLFDSTMNSWRSKHQ